MDNHTQETPQPASAVSTEKPVIPTSKPSNFLTILLSILLLLAVGATGFFAYQTQNLKKQIGELRNMNNELTQTQPTPIPTTNNLQPISTPDPTADWKTYTNSNIRASINYPPNWEMKEETNGKSVDFNTMTISPKVVEGNKVNYFFNFQLEDPNNFQEWTTNGSSKKLESVTVNNLTFERYIGADMFYTLNYIYKSTNGEIYRFYLGPYTQTEQPTSLDNVVNQILSTFRFTE